MTDDDLSRLVREILDAPGPRPDTIGLSPEVWERVRAPRSRWRDMLLTVGDRARFVVWQVRRAWARLTKKNAPGA